MKAFSLICITLLIASAFSGCPSPQAIYRIEGKSLFFGINDIQEGVVQIFGSKLDEVKLQVSSGILSKSTYTLKNIVVHANYVNDKEMETMGDMVINKQGGILELSVSFDYDIDLNQVGKGQGLFSAPFPINLEKTAVFSPEKGLNWNAKLNNIVLTNLAFTRESGSSLTSTEIANFNDMLNRASTGVQNQLTKGFFTLRLGAPKADAFTSVKTQIINRIAGLQIFIGLFNNEIAQQLFSNDYQYVWLGNKMSYDYSLKSYLLNNQGETMMLAAVVNPTSSACYPISAMPIAKTYMGVSKSTIENTFNNLVTNKLLNTKLDYNTWKIPNFYFQVRDLAWVIPTLTKNYGYNDQTTGDCEYASGASPAFQGETNTFDTTLKFNCKLSGEKDGAFIMSFYVNAFFKFSFFIDDVGSVLFKVMSATFMGSEFTTAPQYKIEKPDLATYYVNQAAVLMTDQAVFGTGLVNLPEGVQTSAWKMGDDNNTIFFYDSSL